MDASTQGLFHLYLAHLTAIRSDSKLSMIDRYVIVAEELTARGVTDQMFATLGTMAEGRRDKMERVMNLTCEFCGATRRTTAGSDDVFRLVARTWYREHRPCAQGRSVVLNVSGQRDEQSPAEHILSKRIE